MSKKYDEYIIEHKRAVTMAYDWLRKNLEGITSQDIWDKTEYLISIHDNSKYDENEYKAYDTHFYGNKSYQAEVDFEVAWLKHIHKNPHHWQHWVLYHDDPNKPYTYLEMPTEYMIEMICDWWSFSWRKGDLREIFNWYEEHKIQMLLNVSTREQVVLILDMIKHKLTQMNYTPEVIEDGEE